MTATIGAARVELGINSAEFDAQMKRASAAVGKFKASLNNVKRKFEKVGRKMERTGDKLTRNVSLPIAAIGAASVKSAIDFETAFAGVRKTVDATEQQFDSLRSGILQMSKELPTTATEIAGVAESAGQLGIETESILEFTRTMVMLGDTTDMSANDAATALARLANITQMPQDQFDELGAVVVELGNNLATTESEIVDMGQRLAKTGQQIGLSEDQILGFAGALSSVGIRAEAGGTSFAKLADQINQAIVEGGKQLDMFAQIAGTTGDEFADTFRNNAAEALTQFIEGLGRLNRSGGDALNELNKLGITSVRTREALLGLAGAGDLTRKSMELSSEAVKDNSALTEEAQKRYETLESRLKIVKNQLIAVGITIGEQLMPAVESLSNGLADLADWFNQLHPVTQKMSIAFLGILAAIGPVSKAIGVFTSTVLPALISGFAALSGPGGWIAVGIGALGLLAGAYIENKNKVSEATKKQREFIQALKDGNKTIEEARGAVNDLTASDMLAATQQMIRQKKEQIRLQEKEIRKRREGGTLADKTIDQLKEMEEASKAFDIQELNRMEKQMDQLIDRREMLERLVVAMQKLERAKQIEGQTSTKFTRQKVEMYQQEVDKLKEDLGLVKEIKKEAKEASQETKNLSASLQIKNVGTAGLENLISVSKDAKRSMGEIVFGEEWMENFRALERIKSSKIKSKFDSVRDVMKKFFEDTKTVGEQLASNIAPMIGNAFADIAAQFTQGIAQIAATGGSFKNVIQGILGTLADLAIRVGKIALAVGVAIEGIKKALESLNPVAAIAAGIALIAVGSAAKVALSNAADKTKKASKVPQMAEGAVVSGPTMAVVGDNPNASVDPEVVAPLSKLKNMMGGGRGQVIENVVMLDGNVVYRNQKDVKYKKER